LYCVLGEYCMGIWAWVVVAVVVAVGTTTVKELSSSFTTTRTWLAS